MNFDVTDEEKYLIRRKSLYAAQSECVALNIAVLISPLHTSHQEFPTFFCEDLKNHDTPTLNLITPFKHERFPRTVSASPCPNALSVYEDTAEDTNVHSRPCDALTPKKATDVHGFPLIFTAYCRLPIERGVEENIWAEGDEVIGGWRKLHK
jgi:hypothetical protein